MTDSIDIYNHKISGLAISYAWRGHGSAIFLEIGELTKEEKRNHPIGQYSVMLDCEWRIEDPSQIECGSFCDEGQIEESISNLVGDKVSKVELWGILPEIAIALGSGKRVVSFTADSGQPEWAICLPDKSWLSSKGGSLVHEKA